MVTLLHITMVVRRNLDLATQGAQAAIGQEGCNSLMGSTTMQVLLTDTPCFLFLSVAGSICHVISLLAKSLHSVYGLPLVLNALHNFSQRVPQAMCVCL